MLGLVWRRGISHRTDAMFHRFFIPSSEWNPESPRLTGAEAHHAVDVLRLRVGDAVIVFDGMGTEQAAKVARLGRDVVALEPGPVARTAALPCRIAIAQAIPKGKNMDLIVQKATELGAAAVMPIISERTVVRLDRAEAEAKREKWQRVAVEACKQCGQNFLPVVATPLAMEEFLARHMVDFDLVLVASLLPGARHLKALLAEHIEVRGNAPASVLLLIGPEGDFTPEEVNRALACGAVPLSLGPIVLRAETAAIYGLSVLAHELQAG